MSDYHSGIAEFAGDESEILWGGEVGEHLDSLTENDRVDQPPCFVDEVMFD